MTVPIPVLFTHFGDEWIRGSETVLLDLLRALDKDRVRPVVWCNGAEIANAARSAGYPTYRSKFHLSLDYNMPFSNLFRMRGLVRMCRSICREHNIRVLHANSAAPTQWLVPAGLSARLPVLTHLHIDYRRRSRYVLLVHAATLAVGVSRLAINDLIADGMAPSRTRVIYNGIDVGRLARSTPTLRGILNIPEGAIVIATVGSLVARKGHDILIRAFHSLELSPNPPHLLIVGDGPEQQMLEALTASLGMADRVHFLGYTNDVAAVYQAADIFALASRGDAFALVLAEAGYFGLPSVSTDVGGIPEVIEDEKTGLLARPNDVSSFSAALARLARDPALRDRLGSAAAARVEAMFTVDQMARQFEQTYSGLAAISATRLGWRSALRGVRPYTRLLTGLL